MAAPTCAFHSALTRLKKSAKLNVVPDPSPRCTTTILAVGIFTAGLSALRPRYFLSPVKVGNRIFSLNRPSSSIVQYHSPISTFGRRVKLIGLPTQGFV